MALALGLSNYQEKANCVNLHLKDDQDDGMGSIMDITNDFKTITESKPEQQKPAS